MKNKAELTLLVLECYLKYGPSLSIRDLCKRTKVAKGKVKNILTVLQKRGYLIKTGDIDEYRLSEKIAMLI